MKKKILAVVRQNPRANPRANSLSRLTGKAVSNLLKTWQGVMGTARSVIRYDTIRPDLPDSDIPAMLRQIDACLDPKGGEVTARANTVELGRQYLELDETGRTRFFTLLAEHYDVDHATARRQAELLAQALDKEAWVKAEIALKRTLLSPRVTLFRQFNALPDGFKFLVDMRAAILDTLPSTPDLAMVESDLKDVLSAWFDVGLLDLEEINWRSPAELLEKLMLYEAVHAIRSWEDLKNRTDDDRRIFAFFHNKMPLEPLIFVQVAFSEGLGSSIQEVLDETKPVQNMHTVDTALFYSISNAQRGLAGISFGNFLIKRVVAHLSTEFRTIKHFATLSPIPGFAKWLQDQLKTKQDMALFSPLDIRHLCEWENKPSACEALRALLGTKWQENQELERLLKPILMSLCTQYLTKEKRGTKALDPVAHFHLSNGARIEQLNWLADTSPKGLKQSFGLMVNYYYALSQMDDNHEDYVTDGKVCVSKTGLHRQ